MIEQQFGWNYFENEVVIGDRQDKKRMIVLVFSNFMDIPYNRKSFDELMGLLNGQQATIRRLQDLCGESDSENAKLRIENKKLKEENEKLIQKNCIPCELVNFQTREIDKLKYENEQLRKTMNEVIELLIKEVDLFSEKATEHDIIAYKEMNDFDNKDAYYMCISTKKAIKMLQRCF